MWGAAPGDRTAAATAGSSDRRGPPGRSGARAERSRRPRRFVRPQEPPPRRVRPGSPRAAPPPQRQDPDGAPDNNAGATGGPAAQAPLPAGGPARRRLRGGGGSSSPPRGGSAGPGLRVPRYRAASPELTCTQREGPRVPAPRCSALLRLLGRSLPAPLRAPLPSQRRSPPDMKSLPLPA